jgi:hypothetical protein
MYLRSLIRQKHSGDGMDQTGPILDVYDDDDNDDDNKTKTTK